MKSIHSLFILLFLFLIACGQANDDSVRNTADDLSGSISEDSQLADPWPVIRELRLLPGWIHSHRLVERIVSNIEGISLDPAQLEVRFEENAQYQYDIESTVLPLPTSGDWKSYQGAVYPALIEGVVIIPQGAGELFVYDLWKNSSANIYFPGGFFNSFAYHPEIPGKLFISGQTDLMFLDLASMKLEPLKSFARPMRILNLYPRNQVLTASFSSEPSATTPDTPSSESDSSADQESESESETIEMDAAQTEMLMEVLSDRGWISILDPHGGEELGRSLDMPGFVSASSAGDGRIARISRFELETLSMDDFFEPRPEARVTLPWRNLNSVRVSDDELILIAEDRDSQPEASALSLLSMQLTGNIINWIFNLPEDVEYLFGTEVSGLFLGGNDALRVLNTDQPESLQRFPQIYDPTLTLLRFDTSWLRIDSSGSAASPVGSSREFIQPVYRLPRSALSPEFALALRSPGDAILSNLYESRDFSYQFRNDDLPLEIPIDARLRVRGSFEIASSRQLILRIFDENASELLSSIDKVRVVPGLDYDLSRGKYTLRIEDAGGEEPEDSFILSHSVF